LKEIERIRAACSSTQARIWQSQRELWRLGKDHPEFSIPEVEPVPGSAAVSKAPSRGALEEMVRSGDIGRLLAAEGLTLMADVSSFPELTGEEVVALSRWAVSQKKMKGWATAFLCEGGRAAGLEKFFDPFVVWLACNGRREVEESVAAELDRRQKEAPAVVVTSDRGLSRRSRKREAVVVRGEDFWSSLPLGPLRALSSAPFGPALGATLDVLVGLLDERPGVEPHGLGQLN
jgi:hypothetical protein